MLRLLVFGFAIGAGIQAWRNFPADGLLGPDSLAVVFICGVLGAFVAGWLMGRPWRSAQAVAVASARAAAAAESSSNSSAAVNVLIAQHAAQGGSSAFASNVPTPENVSWMSARPILASVEDLDGMDLSDLGIEETEARA